MKPLPPPAVDAALSAAEQARLFGEMRQFLRHHVTEPWFPRCVDREAGGFFCNYNRQWMPRGQQHRMLESQARQTRSAARLARAFPQEGQWAEIALHGWRYLRDQMWDQELGGWYWMIGRDGQPRENAVKHAHSTAYAIEACVLVHAATGEQAALDRAQEGFAWLDQHGHDNEYGGYQSWLHRDGAVIMPGYSGGSEPLGNDIGTKDINVHGDMIEALTTLFRARPGPLVQDRLASLVHLVCTHMVAEDGALHYGCYRDWRPQASLVRYGYGMQSYYRLMAAAHHVPEAVLARDSALRLMRHIIVRAWAGPEGGLWYAGPAGHPDSLEGASLFVHKRAWWVQFEGLRSMILALVRDGAAVPELREKTLRQWEFVRDRMTDPIFRGVYAVCVEDLPLRQRLIGAVGIRGNRFKSGLWKDASHDTDCMLDCLRVLSGQPAEADVPLPPSIESAT